MELIEHFKARLGVALAADYTTTTIITTTTILRLPTDNILLGSWIKRMNAMCENRGFLVDQGG